LSSPANEHGYDLATARGRLRAYAAMIFVDHGFFRIGWRNWGRVSDDLYRSNGPWPFQVAMAARRGIKTIVNLRGRNLNSGWYLLEREACRRHGIELVDFTAKSRDAPPKEMLFGARDLFDRIAYPALIHCKSGADRAGLMAVLHVAMKGGGDIEAALRRHLSLRYLHIRQAKVGILDYFFRRYLAANRARPIGFMEWVERDYDPVATKAEFMSQWWANLLVDRVLRRE
jgi:protein tyrosine/serine phosphatase